MDIIERAKEFAMRAHDGQVRKGAAREPYTVHLEEVAALAVRFGGSEAVIAAAWLHDTIEDCSVTAGDLRTLFGEEITALVLELTDDKNLPKAERKRQQVLKAPHKSAGATLVKICDKMSNVRAVGETPPVGWPRARQIAYLDWAEEVVGALPAGAEPARAEFRRVLAGTRALLGRAAE